MLFRSGSNSALVANSSAPAATVMDSPATETAVRQSREQQVPTQGTAVDSGLLATNVIAQVASASERENDERNSELRSQNTNGQENASGSSPVAVAAKTDGSSAAVNAAATSTAGSTPAAGNVQQPMNSAVPASDPASEVATANTENAAPAANSGYAEKKQDEIGRAHV